MSTTLAWSMYVNDTLRKFSVHVHLPHTHSDFCSLLHVIVVWEHLLLQLGAAGSVLLPTVSGEDLGVPQSAPTEGEPAHMPGRPVP